MRCRTTRAKTVFMRHPVTLTGSVTAAVGTISCSNEEFVSCSATAQLNLRVSQSQTAVPWVSWVHAIKRFISSITWVHTAACRSS